MADEQEVYFITMAQQLFFTFLTCVYKTIHTAFKITGHGSVNQSGHSSHIIQSISNHSVDWMNEVAVVLYGARPGQINARKRYKA